jgi:hypothetical protein
MKNSLTLQKLTKGLMAALLLANAGCAEESTGQKYNIALSLGNYTTASTKIFNLILPQANASVTQLNFCFKRLRFKKADVDSADPLVEDNIDFDLGDVSISNTGSSLGTIELPAGNYQRVEFDLEDHCASGKSLEVTNSNGTYSTNSRVTIKFSGSFTADADQTLELSVQNILDALNSYNGTGSLRDHAESVSGDL